MAADIISATSAFVPTYGTAVSAGSGLLGTGLNAAADFTDSKVSTKDALINTGTGVVADLIGLIPG